jgi:DNA-binding transcriptional LysR family regulator
LHLLPALVTNSIEALKGFARYSGGVTFLPSLPIRGELDRQVLVSIPIVEDTFQLSTHDVCILAGRRLPLAVEAFVGQLKIEASHAPNERQD